MNAAKIRQMLSNNSMCFISFEKKNGEIRNMICTLKDDFIPLDKKPSNIMDYDKHSQVRVFDIVAQDWRSMIPDNVISIEPYGSHVAEVLHH